MIIESSAPTRVDLVGGTIDIPPLFLFHEGAATVNFAVDLLARCRIETRNDDVESATAANWPSIMASSASLASHASISE